MEIVFTDEDRRAALELAHRQNDPKLALGVPNYRINQRKSDFEIHHRGVLAEFAVAKAHNLKVNTVISLDGDEGFDFLWHGYKIQVKYTYATWGDLFVNKGQELLCDIYILVVGDEQKMTIPGWAEKQDFFDPTRAKEKDLGYGPRLCIEQIALRKSAIFTELADFL